MDNMIISSFGLLGKLNIPDLSKFKAGDTEAINRYMATSLSELIEKVGQGNVPFFRNYQHASLDGFENPSPNQQQALAVLQAMLAGRPELCYSIPKEGSIPKKDFREEPSSSYEPSPLAPKYGMILYGPPGRGKTHMFMAFLRTVKDQVGTKDQLEQRVEEEALRVVETLHQRGITPTGSHKINSSNNTSDYANQAIAEASRFSLERMRSVLASFYSPTDIQVVKFRTFYHRVRKKVQDLEDIDALLQMDVSRDAINAALLVIDELHLEDDPARAHLLQNILEARYDQGNYAAFITANIAPEDMFKAIKDQHLKDRLQSRIDQMCFRFDFSDQKQDYRKLSAEKRDRILRGLLRTASRRRKR